MCIRDRVRKGQPGEKANAPLSDADTATQSGSPAPATGETIPVGEKGEAAARKASEKAAATDIQIPVSYTHLDVSKRQSLYCA